ncbi:hypothetical protein [Microbacterium sp. SLBN-146]|uniref:hypothetical protein n=1 Tax=Microbacterium sp. SLBN-146 TaxID=2768457 RepID=UPI0011722A06|nr:hypothetical protein [Microbacterium sp. SLBN-146]TQJ31941.1 hypothetical protein FBY39_2430 [Microbacterium sp. SLBN-146]
MRGRQLGLSGGDLITYQAGEVALLGAKIDGYFETWIRHRSDWSQGVPKVPFSLKDKHKLARKLAADVPNATPEEVEMMRGALTAAYEAMQHRHAIVHNEWGAFEDRPDVIMLMTRELPSDQPREQSHERWEEVRVELQRASARMHWLVFMAWGIRDVPGHNYDHDFEIVRGEFDILPGGIAYRPWSWRPSEDG